MRTLLRQMVRWLAAEDGPTAVEYAMMLMLVLLACLTAVTMFGRATNTSFQNSSASIDAAIGP